MLGLFGKRVVLSHQEIRIRLMLASSDAPPKLVELGQAEGIGTVYEDCVGVWDVESGFDDGCG